MHDFQLYTLVAGKDSQQLFTKFYRQVFVPSKIHLATFSQWLLLHKTKWSTKKCKHWRLSAKFESVGEIYPPPPPPSVKYILPPPWCCSSFFRWLHSRIDGQIKNVAANVAATDGSISANLLLKIEVKRKRLQMWFLCSASMIPST